MCNSPYLLVIRFSGRGVESVLTLETCAGVLVWRVRPSRGEGVGRASAVSELTERVTFFFFNHEPRAFHYQHQAQNVFSSSTARSSAVAAAFLTTMALRRLYASVARVFWCRRGRAASPRARQESMKK